jgi:hypothetical protein
MALPSDFFAAIGEVLSRGSRKQKGARVRQCFGEPLVPGVTVEGVDELDGAVDDEGAADGEPDAGVDGGIIGDADELAAPAAPVCWRSPASLWSGIEMTALGAGGRGVALEIAGSTGGGGGAAASSMLFNRSVIIFVACLTFAVRVYCRRSAPTACSSWNTAVQ